MLPAHTRAAPSEPLWGGEHPEGGRRVAHPGRLLGHGAEGHRILGISLVCPPTSGGPWSVQSSFCGHCRVQAAEGKGEGQCQVSGKEEESRAALGLPSSLGRRRDPGRTHSSEQTPTAPPCPGSQLPSETPSSVGQKSSTKVTGSQGQAKEPHQQSLSNWE